MRSKKDQQEADDVGERSVPRTPVIYEVIRRHGEEELARPAVSLWWSGVAAGLSISFSPLAVAILHHYLPDQASWRHLAVSLGYPVGFLMVVLSRQQLFTENTITVVLPVLARPSVANVGRLARMWSIVFVANMTGTLFAAAFVSLTPTLSADLYQAMVEVAHHAVEGNTVEMLFGGVGAGFLIAAMVWIIPGTQGAQFPIITLMTYLISAGGFPHIIAGSVEAFLLVVHGDLGIGHMLSGFLVPVLLGNIVGGTVLFALLSYAQVMREI